MDIKVNDEMFEIMTDENRLAAEFIHKVWVRAGRPNRLEGESAWKVMDSLFQVWAACYPQEFLEFKYSLIEEQEAERSVHDANKADGGFVPISYPMRLLQFIRVYFPDQKLQDREITRKFTQRYPVLKRTKYNI